MRIERVIVRLQKSGMRILTLQDIKKLLEIRFDNTAYKTAERLAKKEVLVRLKKGTYSFAFFPPEDFEIANFLYTPSYVSLESALNFYGILPQFPYTVTSVTPRKTKKFEAAQKEFEFVHIQKGLFFGYRKENGFLIAQPEKALIDEIYFAAKGWRKMDFSELDYSKMNSKRLRQMAEKIEHLPFQRLWKNLKL